MLVAPVGKTVAAAANGPSGLREHARPCARARARPEPCGRGRREGRRPDSKEDRLEGVGSGEGLGFVHGRGLREMEFRDGLEFIILALRLTGI